MKIFLSNQPKPVGGGANTFSGLFTKYAKLRGFKVVRKICEADLVIVIAHLAEEEALKEAKNNGSFIVHRLDEYFEKNEDAFRKWKHERIIKLNRYAHVTIFQSWFVFENVYPILRPRNYRVIHNGGDSELFFPSKKIGEFIGHATWGFAPKKRLDLLYDFIKKTPDEKFLLIGRQRQSEIDFSLPNVWMVGEIRRKKVAKYLRKMKLFFFPSENDPCPNAVIEAILCGVPVCYNPRGGTRELVVGTTGERAWEESDNDKLDNTICGLPLERVDEMLGKLEIFRENCVNREDLLFENVFEKYIQVYEERN